MQGINMGRVIIGGIAAGVVYDVIEVVANLYLFEEQAQEMMERFDMAEPSGAQIGIFMVMGLALGIMIAWTYAAIRPRLGAGAGLRRVGRLDFHGAVPQCLLDDRGVVTGRIRNHRHGFSGG